MAPSCWPAARAWCRCSISASSSRRGWSTSTRSRGLPRRTGWGFEEFARRHGDFAIAAAAATLTIANGRCVAARLALIGAGEIVLRSPAAEAVLVGQAVTPDVIAAAAVAAQDAADPRADLQASADFRRHLVAVMSRRALTAAAHA